MDAPAALPIYFWPTAEYNAYLAWLHETSGLDAARVVATSFDLTRIRRTLRLTTDLDQTSGPVLLAGEGDLGADGLYFAFGGPAQEVVALDLVYRGRTASAVEGTVTKMPFADESFNLVVSHMVAHYLRGRRRDGYLHRNHQPDFILEVLRVLRPGGEARLAAFSPAEIDELRPVIGARATIETFAGVVFDTLVMVLKKPTHHPPRAASTAPPPRRTR